MAEIKEQLMTIYGKISLPMKILFVALLIGITFSFAFLIYWANRPVYKILYSNISAEDASLIVDKLQAQNIDYKLDGNGTIIKVQEKDVYLTRIQLAGEGLPSGGKEGYEILDQEQFGATQFQQQINYQRAKQGELARTIMQLDQVENAKVMIVMAKESVFLEESKPATASVLLKLKSDLPKSNVKAIVHLVAGAVEDLAPERVTVIDTTGKILSKGSPDEDNAELAANTQLNYKLTLERNYTERIQSMLEKIVGRGKAIVRVTADLDFNQMDQSEELYDPESKVARSQHLINESAEKNTTPTSDISSVNPIAGNNNTQFKSTEKNQKKDDVINYEISKTVRRTIKPMATIQRLSVAAVLDSNYETVIDDQGNQIQKPVDRQPQELARYDSIVRQAMGYSADREDQVQVESFSFKSFEDLSAEPQPQWYQPYTTPDSLLKFLIFFIVLICLILFVRAMKEIKATVIEAALPPPEETQGLLPGESRETLPDSSEMTPKQKAIHLANEDTEKTINIIRSWMTEAEA